MRERRRRGQNSDSPNFAAQAIDLSKPEDMKYAASIISLSQGRSKTAWDWYDKLGEIHYGVSRSAKVGGYADLGVYKLEANGQIGEKVTTGIAGDIASMLYSPYGGTRGLVERFLTLMKVPADSYLIQAMNGPEGKDWDGFDFVSADELRISDPNSLTHIAAGTGISRITLPASNKMGDTTVSERIAPAGFIGRIWRPSSRWVDLPDSPLGALDALCEQLYLLSIGLRSKLLSRLASNGIFFIPSEINDVRTAAPTGEANEMHQNKVIDMLLKAGVYAARNPTVPEAAMPVFLTGPGEHGEQIRHIIMDQELYDTDMLLRSELIDRILTGLDIQPSQVKGHETANHWSSWSASEDELRVSVRPDLETMCWALTRLVLWKRMQDANIKPGTIQKHVISFDLSKAQSHQNIAEDARQLDDRIRLSPSAVRNASGFEERDAPSSIEYIRAVGVKTGVPYLATYGMEEAKDFDWEKIVPTKTGPNPDSQAQPSSSQPGKGQPGSPSDNKTKTPARLRPA